ncbi:hypothetical protein ScPMuIL_003386 [Solemya velum]
MGLKLSNGTDTSSTRSITRVISVSRGMNGVVCTCSGSQSDIGWTGADSVTFTVYYGPDSAEITGNTRVKASTQMTLTCAATSYSPGVTFQWTKRGATVGDSSGTYRFNPQASDDDAVVVCVAKNTEHLTKQKQISVTLNILYPPSSGLVIIGYSTGQVLTEGVSPATVTLTCTVGVSNPVPTLTWNSNCPKGNDATNTRSITHVINVSRGMNGVVCTCSGSQSDTGWTGTDSVTFTVHYGPDTAEITGNTRVVAGTQMTLTCTATSYSPGVIYQWTKKGATVGTSSGTYQFTPQAADDEAVVVCAAKNSQHLTKHKQDSVTLDILYTPSSGPVITGLPNQHLREGRTPTTVTLTCTVGMANPLPTLTWNCPAGTDSSSTRSITRVIPVHRRIDGVTCTCSGSQPVTGWTGADTETFSATVLALCRPPPDEEDYFHLIESAILQLLIPPPDPLLNIRNRLFADGTSNTSIQAPDVTTEGETVTISCSSLGNPAPTYTITGPRKTSNQGTLEIADIDRSDSGQYSCIAVNSYNSETKTVDVKVQYPPDVSVTYTNVTENDIGMVITCDATGEPPTYNFSLWKHIGPDEHTEIRHLLGKQNGDQFTFTFNDPITYEDSGYYTCIVSNGIKGRSQQIQQTQISGYFVVEGLSNVCVYGMRVNLEADDNIGLESDMDDNSDSDDSFSKAKEIKSIAVIEQGFFATVQKIASEKNAFAFVVSGYFLSDTVQRSPKVLTEDNEVRGNLGENVILTVAFYSQPTFTSLQWFKQHQQASVLLKSNNSEHTIVTRVSDLEAKFHGKEVTVPGYITSINYNNVTGVDFTSYTVVINNTEGSSVFIITFKEVTVPCPPHTRKEGEHTTTSANISWKSGCNGGAAQTFYIEYKKTKDTVWTSGPTVPQLSDSDNEIFNSEITGLDPDTIYHIRIKTNNVIGQNTSDSIEGGENIDDRKVRCGLDIPRDRSGCWDGAGIIGHISNRSTGAMEEGNTTYVLLSSDCHSSCTGREENIVYKCQIQEL